MYTDGVFLYGSYKLTNYLIKHGITVYQYVLTYKGEHSFAKFFYGIIEPKLVCHADDLLYQWKFSMNELNITLNEVKQMLMLRDD